MNDSERMIAAYRQGGLTADILQMQIGGKWGPYWSVISCSTRAMEGAARQCNRSRAARVRHWRQAKLTDAGGRDRLVVILTVLPEREQSVWSLKTGDPVSVRPFLMDEPLKILVEGFIGVASRNGK